MSLKIQGGIVNIGSYHDHSREYNIDARGRDLKDILRACEAEDIVPETPVSEVAPRESEAAAPDSSFPIPPENDYNAVRDYINHRLKHDPEFKYFYETHTRKELCQHLTSTFHWIVDDNALGKNLNRHR